MEKCKQEPVGGDGEDTLYDQSPEESPQRIFTGSAGGGIEVVTERNRDHFIKVDMGF